MRLYVVMNHCNHYNHINHCKTEHEMKNRSHRYDINNPRSRDIVNIRSVSS